MIDIRCSTPLMDLKLVHGESKKIIKGSLATVDFTRLALIVDVELNILVVSKSKETMGILACHSNCHGQKSFLYLLSDNQEDGVHVYSYFKKFRERSNSPV